MIFSLNIIYENLFQEFRRKPQISVLQIRLRQQRFLLSRLLHAAVPKDSRQEHRDFFRSKQGSRDYMRGIRVHRILR